MPSTNTLEKRVVFGGENHLRELTKMTGEKQKKINAEQYIKKKEEKSEERSY